MSPMTPDEIKKMERSCQLAAQILQYTSQYIKPGVTTDELDKIADDFTRTKGALSAPLGYKGYPKATCTSVNHCVCHGVPNQIPLKEGDVVNLDVTCVLEGFYGDTSATFFVGEVSSAARELAEVAEQAMYKGIDQVRPFATTGDIGFAINKFVTRKGYFAVREIGGHGIGNVFHGDPFVPSFGKKGRGDKLRPWTCITVEPMVNQTDASIVEFDIPGSSIKYYETADKCLSAQFEHTLLITDVGHEILTVR